MLRRYLLAVLILGLVPIAAATAEEPLFPMVLSTDNSGTIADVSGWLARPAGGQGFVRAEGGHLATDAGPIRFWAANLCFEACFPTHEDAERLAARLAGLGINCIRMHHMDSHSIWGKSTNRMTIDPEKLDRLDYLIAQLKQHGVYVNVNLHVSRTLGDKEGFPNADGRPKYDKGIGNLDPRMIDAQKKYARDLLTHVNPYTKTAYREEPAVAFVEISNEDALFAVWGWGQMDDLAEPYATTYRTLWNAWLRKKYGATEQLRKAWNAGQQPLGEEMLTNGGFASQPGANWHLEKDSDSEVTWAADESGGPDGKPCLRIVVTRRGRTPWRPQFNQPGLTVKKDRAYTLTFFARADKPQKISVSCMMAHDPWQRLGLSSNASLTAEWKQFRYTFIADRDDENARVGFSELGLGTYRFADISLRPGGIVGLEADQKLEDDSVPVMKRSQANMTRAARNDFIDFLWDTEQAYWSGMHKFLKEELGVRSLVTGTQLNYSPVYVQAEMDYIDAHSYWHHPHFPGRPWDSRNWTVRNAALVNSPGGTLAGLAERRVAGMAFTVSEYNHPAPNSYAAEGFPMIAAFGRFQDWDGVFLFTYSHSTEFDPRRVTGFFDIKADTSRLVHMPACAALFLRGDAQTARKTIRVPLSRAEERAKLHETLSAWTINAGDLGLDPRWSLVHGIAMELTGDRSLAAETEFMKLPDQQGGFQSDTGQIQWDLISKDHGCFTVDTPRTKLFTGFDQGRAVALGDVGFALGTTRLGWATVSMVAIDAEAIGRPGRVLIAATGWTQNTGAELQDLGGGLVTLSNQWGKEPILCEGVPAEITLPVPAKRVTFYPLDESGRRRQAAPVTERDGEAVIKLGPQHKTVWYEVEVR